MGNCRSCEATAVATGAAPAMANLVLQNGELRAFEQSVMVSQVLQMDPGCFVCNADDMEFDGLVSSVNADEELLPGQLYFLLPRSMLGRPLQADEMAALAGRASAALMKCRCRRGSVAPLVFTDRPRADPTAGCGRVGVEERKRHRRAGSSGRGRNFTSMLSAIPETPE